MPSSQTATRADLKIKSVPLSKLHVDPANARRHNKKNLEAIRGSLQQFGQVEPLVVQKGTGKVIGGNGRLEVMQRAGRERVDVVEIDVDDAQAAALAIALNRTAELADWDLDALDDVIGSLGDLDLSAIGFTSKDLDGLFPGDGVVQDEVPEVPKVAVTKLGDVWQLGRHRVVCGDCRETRTGGFVSVVTDPPYGMSFRSNHRGEKHAPIEGDNTSDLLAYACGLDAAHSKYIWCRWDNLGSVPNPKSVITWVKNNWSMGDLEHEHGRQTEIVLFYPGSAHTWPDKRPADVLEATRTGNDLHPTQKPVRLIADVVAWTSGVVLDPFIGSGTTLIAAEQLDRTCYGIEIEPRYVDVTVERWENSTNGKAKRKHG